jgi:hypothetical protein
MKKIISISILILFISHANAQLGSTKAEIIKEFEDYTLDVADDGTDYITYSVDYKNYTRVVACYLTEKKDANQQTCVRVLMIEPKFETNNWVKWFNDENFVKLEGMKWKDYENSVTYKVILEGENCLVFKEFDTKL